MPFRILSLDGGGIRGVIGATLLAAVEKRINKPLNEYFHLIAGTSTGSVLAGAIAVGRSSQEIVDLYKQQSSIIFPYRSLFSPQRLPLLLKYGLSAPKYSDSGLIKVFQEAFGDIKLLDITEPRLLIVSYDTISRQAIIFKSWRINPDYGNLPLWEACVCSASAPTYFPAHKIDRKIIGLTQSATADSITLDKSASAVEDIYNNTHIHITSGVGEGQVRKIKDYVGFTGRAVLDSPWDRTPEENSSYLIKTIYSAIDGGVAANNPSSCAVAEALRLGYQVEDIYVLSIGTGELTRIIPFEKVQGFGLIQWAEPLISILLDASSGVYEYITDKIIHDRVLRLQFKLDRGLTGKRLSDDIDDVSPQNIDNLIEAAQIYVKQPSVEAALENFLRISQ